MLRLDLDDPRWIEFVRNSSDATFFHHPAWARLVADCYGYPAMAVAVTDASRGFAAGLPLVEVRQPFAGRRWVALPFTDYCPALGTEDARRQLLAAIVAEAPASGVGGIEVRGAVGVVEGFEYRSAAVRHTVELASGTSALFPRLSSMHRRNIRAAQRSGLRIARGSAPIDLETFYRLHLLTRRRLGVPIQPRRFFQLFQRRVIDAGYGFVLTAFLHELPIASAVFVAWNDVLIYKYGASDERYWQYRPNNLVLWSAIEWGCENGYRTFDLGRTDLQDAGLRAFKDGWAATEHPLLHYGTGLSDQGRPIAGRALAAVIRRAHPWVTRAVGEILYRYAA